MAGVEIKLDKRFLSRVRGRYHKYGFEVGVIKDGPYRTAKPSSKGLKKVAGGPARKIGLKSSGLTVSQVSKAARQTTGVNFYTRPFRSRKNRDILRFTKSFFDLCAGRSEKKRCENLLQAIVRNPITRGDYGGNTQLTAKIKGFSRLLVDTGQLFKSITARVVRGRR